MRFGVLGTLEVVDGERVLDLGRPKQRAVLAVLLLEANRVVGLDRLIDLLWGEEAPARSTASLQAYVSNLRRILEPGRSPRTPPEVLLTQPPGYVIRVGPEELDASRFETLAASGPRLLAGGRPQEALDALDAALSLWRGPALADFAYEDFARAPARRWEELREVAAEDRMDAVLALGRHAAAVGELEALVAEAPLRERRWAQLVVALYRCGRQGDALRAYARARATLAEELGVDPGPDLARLEADVLAQAPHLEWRPPAYDPVAGTPVPPAADMGGEVVVHGAPATAAPLVGREQQVDVLSRALAGARAGRGRAVLVSGEAGIGKSRLLEELADRAAAAGAIVAWGRAHESAGAPAFWPWAQVLRSVLAEADSPELRRAVGPEASVLVQLLPELASWGAGPPLPSLDAETARARLYEAVTSVLHRAAGMRPLVVLLDDLHWADPASLAMTEFLVSQQPSGPLLLAAAYRPEEVAGDHPLLATLAAFARVRELDRLELQGLGPPDVARFVSEAAGVEAPREVVDDLHARTEGNPFYLSELVRLLAAERALATPGAVTAARIPAGVRDVVRRRLARLPDATNTLLRFGAVIGREFDLTLVAAAAGLEEEEALVSAEAAVLVGLVVEAPETVGRYRFAHALVQQALYEQLSGLRRARLHARVGEAVEARVRGDDRLGELAHHFFEAAPAVGPDKGIQYAVRAADAAQARLAYEEAQEQLRRALRLIASMAPGTDRATREIGVQLRLAGWVSLVDGFAAPEAGEAWARATALCLEHGLTGLLLGALSGEWIFSLMRGDHAAAQAARDRIVDFGRATGDTAFVMLGEFHTGYLAVQRGELAASLEHLDRAAELVAGLDAGWLIEVLHLHPAVLFLGVRGLVLWLSGRQADARAAAEQSLALAAQVAHPFTTAVALFNACVLDAFAGDAATARARAEEGIELTAQVGLRNDEAHLHTVRGWAVAVGGDPGAGVPEVEAALAEIKAFGRLMSRSFLLGLLAEAHRAAGHVDQALAAVEEGLAVAETTNERFWEAELYRLRGELLLERSPEAVGEAEPWLRRAVEVAGGQGAVVLRRRAEESLSRLASAHL